MRSIRARDTVPETALRRMIRSSGERGYRVAPRITGRPDLAWSGLRVAVFVDGCFWHGCPEHCRIPKTRPDYWPAKIERNRRRDLRVATELEGAGWRVIRIWEHDVQTNAEAAAARVLTLVRGSR